MSPRPAKGTMPKGPQPVISFRVPRETLSRISEIRVLAPRVEPGLVPDSIRSDADFARWLVQEGAQTLSRRLSAQLEIKDLIVKDKYLQDRQEYVRHLRDAGKIDKQSFVDSMEELQEEIDHNYFEIEKICRLNLINPPEGYAWSEDRKPFDFVDTRISDENHRTYVDFLDFRDYMLYPERRDGISSKRKTRIAKFAQEFGWSIDGDLEERLILIDLLNDEHPICQWMKSNERTTLLGRRELRDLVRKRLNALDTCSRPGGEG